MASGKSVWGVEIGQCALKALKLREVNGQVQAEAFDIIEHPKILSQPEADRNQLIRNALEQFQTRNNVSGSHLVVSVPGQSSFTRFIKLPPVDPKRIPEIVKFEAEQQIPFPINDVIWRWQTFQKEDSPDIELGIFAIKRVDVSDALEHFSQVQLDVDVVQMAPLALCNFMFWDDQLATDGATLLADVGVDKTDLVVADGSRIWMRTIQLGGSSFTEALVRAFKLPFNKAEKLKRSAASSKYARQIFQAMRPVFADLVQEIQRSIGFYTQLHRETRFKKLVGLGNGFRLPGLQKFLEQNLNVPVSRVDSFHNLKTSEAINAPAFTENVLSFAVAYGLAVQGMGYATVHTNLLPTEVTRKRLWASKRAWFTGAAACLIAASGLYAYGQDRKAQKVQQITRQPDYRQARSTLQEIQQRQKKHSSLRLTDEREKAVETIKLHAYKNTIPQVTAFLSRILQRVTPHQSIYNEVFEVRQKMNLLDTQSQAYQQLAAREQALVRQLKNIDRKDRRLITVERIRTQFVEDIEEYDGRTLEAFVNDLIGTESGRGSFMERREQDRGRDAEDRDPEGPDGPPEPVAPPQKGVLLVVTGRSPANQLLLSDMLRQVGNLSQEIVDSPRSDDLSAISYHEYYHKIDVTNKLRTQLASSSDDRERDVFARRRDDRDDTMGAQRILVEPDPLFSDDPLRGEESSKDLYFVAVWVLPVVDDGIDVETDDEDSQSGSVARR
jgi:type IV pilus assembly protein PilM